MSRSSSFVITLPEADRAELQRRARCYSAPHAGVVRAKIVLLAADGLENMQIAARPDVHVNVVGRWRRRFAEEGLAGAVSPRHAKCLGAAKTAAIIIASYRRMTTGLEHRPRRQPLLDNPGWSAHAYGQMVSVWCRSARGERWVEFLVRV
jgi:hypothetical protein